MKKTKTDRFEFYSMVIEWSKDQHRYTPGLQTIDFKEKYARLFRAMRKAYSIKIMLCKAANLDPNCCKIVGVGVRGFKYK